MLQFTFKFNAMIMSNLLYSTSYYDLLTGISKQCHVTTILQKLLLAIQQGILHSSTTFRMESWGSTYEEPQTSVKLMSNTSYFQITYEKNHS